MAICGAVFEVTICKAQTARSKVLLLCRYVPNSPSNQLVLFEFVSHGLGLCGTGREGGGLNREGSSRHSAKGKDEGETNGSKAGKEGVMLVEENRQTKTATT